MAPQNAALRNLKVCMKGANDPSGEGRLPGDLRERRGWWHDDRRQGLRHRRRERGLRDRWRQGLHRRQGLLTWWSVTADHVGQPVPSWTPSPEGCGVRSRPEDARRRPGYDGRDALASTPRRVPPDRRLRRRRLWPGRRDDQLPARRRGPTAHRPRPRRTSPRRARRGRLRRRRPGRPDRHRLGPDLGQPSQGFSAIRGLGAGAKRARPGRHRPRWPSRGPTRRRSRPSTRARCPRTSTRRTGSPDRSRTAGTCWT